MMNDWNDIRRWRRAMRAELLKRRLAVPRAEKPRIRSLVGGLIAEHFPELCQACIGFYWPIKAEIDLRHLVGERIALGAEASLPAVIEKQQPVEFRAWRPRMKMARGFWNIPVPPQRDVVRPTALLVPLVGFDESGFRLGYGGGYYDRTLAAMTPRPLTIGIGYEFGRLETIYPQPHDIPLDAIVTEAGCLRFRDRGEPLKDTAPAGEAVGLCEEGSATYASPPCSLHELDPSYLGYMTSSEVMELLNLLLEGERAGARGSAEMARPVAGDPRAATLRGIARDEAAFCAMLSRHIVRLGGSPSGETGRFYDRLMALETVDARIDLLNRGQAWVVRKLQEGLPRIGDRALHSDLTKMLRVHERNIRQCTEMGRELGAESE
jgi:5-formyltetrahydrofolate cyclo-ligase